MTEHEHLAHQAHHCVQLVPLFSKLSSEELAQVEQIVHHQKFEKGELIIAPDTTPQLTIIAQGLLKMYQLSANGKEQLLRVVDAGGYEGENALFGAINENLFGESLTDTEICFIRQKDFRNLLLNSPQLSLRLLEINAEKSTQTQQQAQFLIMEDVEGRIANYLLQLMRVENSNQITLPMKMKDLAAFIGTTPETVSRKFKIFEEKALIRRKGRNIEILNKDELEDRYM